MNGLVTNTCSFHQQIRLIRAHPVTHSETIRTGLARDSAVFSARKRRLITRVYRPRDKLALGLMAYKESPRAPCELF